MGDEKCLSSMVSANRVFASGWMEGSVVVGAVRERERDTVRDRRNSNRVIAGPMRTLT